MGYRTKKPGETLSQYVKRRVREEGPLTPEQERTGCIDGNKQYENEGAAVTIMLGGGKGKKQTKSNVPSSDPVECKKQATVDDDKARMPIKDMTAQDEGAGFVIGVGGNVPERQTEPKRSPSASSSRIPSRGGGKSKRR